MRTWKPSLGAWREGSLTHFRVWAPGIKRLEVIVETPNRAPLILPLEKSSNGFFHGATSKVTSGDLYRYRLNGGDSYPDPASRYQPLGVHGPSQVIHPSAFEWTDQGWTGVDLDDLVLYELHVGTFTPAGTFAAAAQRLPYLRDLGVTAVELLPVADFAGERNWGYDGVVLYAPARCYGAPDDLRRLVNEAHRLGLAVHLDVVYNHLGPDGAYHGMFSPYYFSQKHKSPWGAGVNFDGEGSKEARGFFIENAVHWIHEYHMDGLRLDATHAIQDESPRHILAELTAALRESMAGSRRQVLVIAENVRNLAHMVKSESQRGWGLDGVWSDDFHHQMRRCLAGDSDGYFRDFGGTTAEIATTISGGWFYSGQHAEYFGGARGTDPTGIPLRRFVFFIQNHDQIGNRAFGERLNHQIDLADYRAATALLLLAPETPLLFMGQEWAASSPFRFFTDHHEELGRLVTEGRRREFSRFSAFASPEHRARIPDPQDLRTFEASRLNWEEQETEPHASMLRLTIALLALRRQEPALCSYERDSMEITALSDSALLMQRSAPAAPTVLVVCQLHGPGVVSLRETSSAPQGAEDQWELLLTTEEKAFAPDPLPPRIEGARLIIEFARPGVVVLRQRVASRKAV